jgi:hypothetical protein
MKHELRLTIITQFINHKNQQVNASQGDKPCLIKPIKKPTRKAYVKADGTNSYHFALYVVKT